MNKNIFYTFTIFCSIFMSFLYYLYIPTSVQNNIIVDNIKSDIVNTYNYNNIDINILEIDTFLSGAIDSESEYIEAQENKHLKTPENVKSLYFSANSINNSEKLENFFKIVKDKEINSILLDIKEVDGYISFSLDDEKFGKIKPKSRSTITDIEGIIKRLHKNNVYIIARIAVFKDKRLAEDRPDLAIKWTNGGTVWSDYNGNKYTDPYSKEVWDYHKELAIAVYELGFDEINFDYIRFPTDGYISKTYYPFSKKIINEHKKWGKIMIIDKFSNYLTSELRNKIPDIVLSADIFGLTTDTNLFQIGQNLESFLLSFDYVGPMIYPSHYGKGYYGYTYPDNNPYHIINNALNNAIKKIDNLNKEIINAKNENRDIKHNNMFTYSNNTLTNKVIEYTKIRPFLQGFSCTWCTNYTLYNRDKFRKEVKAVNDTGLDSWWVRSSGSYYRYDRYNDNIK